MSLTGITLLWCSVAHMLWKSFWCCTYAPSQMGLVMLWLPCVDIASSVTFRGTPFLHFIV